MGSSDFVTLFFLVAAVLIFLQLRSVLGRRTGNEKPPFDPFSARDKAGNPDASADNGKVVTLPRREPGEGGEDAFAPIDAVAPAGSALNAALRDIARTDPSFNPKEFLNGARMAYEMIVMAFADGDRKTLKGLLSREVYEGFDAAITEREKRGEKAESNFVSIDKADLTAVELKGKAAQVTVAFVSQLISVTRDAQGNVVDGSADQVSEVNDIWTFARQLGSRDPNWLLVATEAGA